MTQVERRSHSCRAHPEADGNAIEIRWGRQAALTVRINLISQGDQWKRPAVVFFPKTLRLPMGGP